MEDVEIGDTLLQLADAGDLQDGIGLCQSLSRKPRKGEDREKIRAVARKLTERFPDEPALHVAVATMLLRSGTLSDAHEQLRQIKRAFPEEERVHELLGEVLLRMGDARGSVVAFERALTLQHDVAIEEVLTEARVLTRLQDARGAEAVAAEARDILGSASEPLAVRRRGLSDVKTPIVHDVRAMVDRVSGGTSRAGASVRPATPSRSVPPARSAAPMPRTTSVSPGKRGSDAPPAYASAAPPPRGAMGSGSSLHTSGPPPGEMPHVHARAEDPQVSRRTWILGGIAAAATLTAGGLLASRYSEGMRFDRAVIDLAIEAMLTAQPSQLDRAIAFTRRILPQAPRSSEVGVRAAQAAVLGFLDGRESPGGLEAAIEEARSRGASPQEVAPGEALALLQRGQVAEAKARIDGSTPDEQPIDAVVYHVVRGVVLERASDGGARAAYEAAVQAEPRAVAALVRIARMHIAEGDGEAASAAIERIAKLGEDRRPLVVALETIARHAGVPLAGASDAAAAPRRLDDDTPRSLRAAGIALEAAAVADDAQAGAMMGAAVLAAETAGDAALVGRIALRRGARGAASFAVSRATELGASNPRAAFLAAQLAFERGDLARVEELSKRLPDRAGASCAGLLAYERGDLRALREAAPRASSILTGALKLATARLEGTRPLEAAELTRLATDEGPFGELVAVDGWLDRGADSDLESAAAVAIRGWTDSLGAVRAARVARLRRLRDEVEEAHDAIAQAAELSTPAVLVEALLLRTKADTGLTQRAEAAPEAARPWLVALERATARDTTGAKKLLKDVKVPGPEAGLVVRLAAMHALQAAKDDRAKALKKELDAVFSSGRDSRPTRQASGGGRRAAPPPSDTYE